MRILSNLLALVVILAVVVAMVGAPWPVLLGCLLAFAAWLAFSRTGRQALSITAVGLTTLSQRSGSAAVTVIGIAGVVGVLVAMLAMAQGYQETLRRTGSPDTAIVMRGGSASEVASVLDRDSASAIAEAPGIARDPAGNLLTSPELVVAANLPIRNGRNADDFGSVQLRGIGERAWQIRGNAHLVAGRKFGTGLHELVAGKGAQRQFANLEPGRQIHLGSQVWTVVGIFETNDALESELWADAQVVGPAYRRGSGITSVYAKLTQPAAFDAFKAALTKDPRLKVDVLGTAEYFGRQSERITQIITIIAIVVGSIMAVGAVFGALNTMFATVATRAREIATLRAIGFRGQPVVIAVMLETMTLALAGGLLGGLLSWAAFNGYTASTMGGVGQLTFKFQVAPQLLWTGLKWALTIGFIGGLFPALRAARLPVATALRDL